MGLTGDTILFSIRQELTGVGLLAKRFGSGLKRLLHGGTKKTPVSRVWFFAFETNVFKFTISVVAKHPFVMIRKAEALRNRTALLWGRPEPRPRGNHTVPWHICLKPCL